MIPGAEADRSADWPADAVEVGRILGAFGVRGEIKVKPLSADPQALFSSKRWFVAAPLAAPGPKREPPPSLLRVKAAREHGETVLASVHDISDRDAALALAGWRVFVSRASFPTPDPDEFYWVDLIGLEVLNREGRSFGPVLGLIETGPHCVLRLAGESPEGAERLIPFVSAYVDNVDLEAKRIVVDWSADY